VAEPFFDAVAALVRKSPDGWLHDVFESLYRQPATASPDFVVQRMPTTNNADLSWLMSEVIRIGSGQMPWLAMAWAIKTAHETVKQLQKQHQVELLWSGPAPASQISARRIDQVLYDLINGAKDEILLVTFAAAKITRLTDGLLAAIQRGVTVRLILEFEQSSEGQLSYDALQAFPSELKASAKVFYWPTERRKRNERGRPGKLHAKVAVIDGVVLIFSANLTDDAFSRNLELGVCLHGAEVRKNIVGHFDALIEQHELMAMEPASAAAPSPPGRGRE